MFMGLLKARANCGPGFFCGLAQFLIEKYQGAELIQQAEDNHYLCKPK